jgi:valine dehydrogenase (NAD+)
MDLFAGGHEAVLAFQDRACGLRGFIGLHSTALGPGLGGTRFFPYASDDDALADVLRLSQAMSYKNALAGLDHGGGKAVIIGDPARDKSAELLRAYGRVVQSLGGRYVTAADVGTYVADMDVVSEVCDFVTGRSPDRGGAGDSGRLTAYGVHRGMQACAKWLWGAPTLRGRTVGIAGVGKVGSRLTDLLVADGARVVVTDVERAAVDAVLDRHPSNVRAVDDTDALLAEPLDVYSPNALGGALDRRTVAALAAAIVCGGANNQLTEPALADELAARDVLYAPDFLVNAGGVIQVADELHGFDFDRAQAKVAQIFDTTLAVLELAAADGVAPVVAAQRLAEARMAGGT